MSNRHPTEPVDRRTRLIRRSWSTTGRTAIIVSGLLLAMGTGGLAFAGLSHRADASPPARHLARALGLHGTKRASDTLTGYWSLTGNRGTHPGPNFLGTTDNVPLVLKTNNHEALRIGGAGNLGLGTTKPAAKLDVEATSSNKFAMVATSVGTAPALVARPSTVDLSTCTGAYVIACLAGSSGVGVLGVDTAGGTGLEGASSSGIGVLGSANSGSGVRGEANTGTGVDAESDSGFAVHGDTSTGIGVYGTTAAGRAIVGTVGGSPCAAPVAGGVASVGVGGCGGNVGFGVIGESNVKN